MSFEEGELAHCKQAAIYLRCCDNMNCEHSEGWRTLTSEELADAFIRERALAREERASWESCAEARRVALVASSAKLAAIEALCAESETDGSEHPWEDYRGDCWVRTESVRKILGGGS